jgi:hypothetical protein
LKIFKTQIKKPTQNNEPLVCRKFFLVYFPIK